MPRADLNPYRLTFRGEPVRFLHRPQKYTWASVYDEQHVVLTYPEVNGKIAFVPRIAATFKTAESAIRYLRDSSSLDTYSGQSFIIHALPGNATEIIEAPVVEHRKAGSR